MQRRHARKRRQHVHHTDATWYCRSNTSTKSHDKVTRQQQKHQEWRRRRFPESISALLTNSEDYDMKAKRKTWPRLDWDPVRVLVAFGCWRVAFGTVFGFQGRFRWPRSGGLKLKRRKFGAIPSNQIPPGFNWTHIPVWSVRDFVRVGKTCLIVLFQGLVDGFHYPKTTWYRNSKGICQELIVPT